MELVKTSLIQYSLIIVTTHHRDGNQNSVTTTISVCQNVLNLYDKRIQLDCNKGTRVKS